MKLMGLTHTFLSPKKKKKKINLLMIFINDFELVGTETKICVYTRTKCIFVYSKIGLDSFWHRCSSVMISTYFFGKKIIVYILNIILVPQYAAGQLESPNLSCTKLFFLGIFRTLLVVFFSLIKKNIFPFYYVI